VFTARYALSPYIKQMHFIVKGLMAAGTAPHWKACERPSGENILILAMVWFSLMMLYRMWHSRLNLLQESGWETLDHQYTVLIWQSFIGFLLWRRTAEDIVLPAVRTLDMLPSCGWCNRYIHCFCPGWTDLQDTDMCINCQSGYIENSIPMTLSLCIVSLLR
jgi:hypothetical protein